MGNLVAGVCVNLWGVECGLKAVKGVVDGIGEGEL